jgi:hypothetical protein
LAEKSARLKLGWGLKFFYMGKIHAYEMWESLTKLYQSTNENRKMVLREKLKSIKMTKAENVVTYLTRLT